MALLVQSISQLPVEALSPLKGQVVPLEKAEELVHSLNGRIRVLETQVLDSETQRLTERSDNQRRLLQVCLDKDRLNLELTNARAEVARLNAVEAELRIVQARRDEDQQRLAHLQEQVNVGRDEVGALTRQVGLEREQVQRLAVQLQLAIDRGDALEGQVRRVTVLMEQQQQLIIQQQRESEEAKLRAEDEEYLNETGLERNLYGLAALPRVLDDLIKRIFG